VRLVLHLIRRINQRFLSLSIHFFLHETALFSAGGFGFSGVCIDQNFSAANENSFMGSACSMPVDLCQKLLQRLR
jgi:hypothetical protein